MDNIYRKIAVLLSIIMVISSHKIGDGFVYAADDKIMEVCATLSPDINDAELILYDKSYYTYDGKAKKIKGLSYKGQTLVSDRDYKINYLNRSNYNAGTASGIITGQGEYVGEKSFSFNIYKASIKTQTISAPDVSYNGLKQNPVTVEGLVAEEDYKIGYGDYDLVNAGIVTATVWGVGINYIDSTEVSYRILPIDMSEVDISGLDEYYIYTGENIEPEIQVSYNGVQLLKDTDYSVEYTNNKDVGKASIIIKGLDRNIVKDSIMTREFDIYKGVINADTTVVEGLEHVILEDGAAYPLFKVSCNGVYLTEDEDYSYKYEGDLTAPGKVKLIITGQGEYHGTLAIEFEIYDEDPIDISGGGVVASLSVNTVSYDGTEIKPRVSVLVSGNELKEGEDFTVSYADNIDAGNAVVTVKGINKYTGRRKLYFEILPRSIKEADFIYDKVQNFTTGEVEPELEVTFNGMQLHERLDYIKSYSNNVNVGKAKITVSGNYNFDDVAVLDFEIVNPYAEDEKEDTPSDNNSPGEDNPSDEEDSGNSEDNGKESVDDSKNTETVSSNLNRIEDAIKKNLGAVDDTIALTLVGSKYYLSARDISGNNAVITIARGNKFRITDAMTGSFASASRKHVAVSSKGVVSARRATNGTKIIMMNDKGETVGITVRVIKPLISANHKKTIWLKRGMNIKLAIDVPLNMYLRSIRNDGVANITGTGFNEAGKYVISGKALTRGTIIVRMKVNNRNYWVKIGVL